MSYQIPSKVKILRVFSAGKVWLRSFTPTEDIKAGDVIVTMYLNGLLDSPFIMRVNIYLDKEGTRKVISSEDFVNSPNRPLRYFCERRFTFKELKNFLTIGHKYYLELEIVAADFTTDDDNYLGLVIDHDSPLAILNSELNIIRHSVFNLKV